MAIRYSITLLCALTVFAVGSGIGRVKAADEQNAVPVAEVYAAAAVAAAEQALPILPTVYVTAPSPAPVAHAGPSVMLDQAVGHAGTALAHGARRSVRRIGLAMPYYAFGASARGTE